MAMTVWTWLQRLTTVYALQYSCQSQLPSHESSESRTKHLISALTVALLANLGMGWLYDYAATCDIDSDLK